MYWWFLIVACVVVVAAAAAAAAAMVVLLQTYCASSSLPSLSSSLIGYQRRGTLYDGLSWTGVNVVAVLCGLDWIGLDRCSKTKTKHKNVSQPVICC